MTEFIMVRHGQSKANVEGIYAAHIDTPLSPLGQEQAARLGEYLKDTKIDAVYSSDLHRAQDTARPTAQNHGLTIIPRQELREIFGGDWEGKRFEDLVKAYPEEYGIWLSDVGRSCPVRGESVAAVSERMQKEVARIAALHPDQTVLIATHALALRTLCTAAAGLPVERMGEVPFVSNASISRFRFDEGTLTLIAMDETEHLEGMESNLPRNV